MNPTLAKLVLLSAVALSPSIASAYVGPGVGLGVLGTLFGLVAAVVLGVLGFLWYPLKRLLGKRKAGRGTAPSADVAPDAAPGTDTAARTDVTGDAAPSAIPPAAAPTAVVTPTAIPPGAVPPAAASPDAVSPDAAATAPGAPGTIVDEHDAPPPPAR